MSIGFPVLHRCRSMHCGSLCDSVPRSAAASRSYGSQRMRARSDLRHRRTMRARCPASASKLQRVARERRKSDASKQRFVSSLRSRTLDFDAVAVPRHVETLRARLHIATGDVVRDGWRRYDANASVVQPSTMFATSTRCVVRQCSCIRAMRRIRVPTETNAMQAWPISEALWRHRCSWTMARGKSRNRRSCWRCCTTESAPGRAGRAIAASATLRAGAYANGCWRLRRAASDSRLASRPPIPDRANQLCNTEH